MQLTPPSEREVVVYRGADQRVHECDLGENAPGHQRQQVGRERLVQRAQRIAHTRDLIGQAQRASGAGDGSRCHQILSGRADSGHPREHRRRERVGGREHTAVGCERIVG